MMLYHRVAGLPPDVGMTLIIPRPKRSRFPAPGRAQ